MKTKEEILQFFESQAREWYKKRGLILFRHADPQETVLTIVAGRLETINTAGEDEIVVRNIEIGSSAEIYIMKEAVFTKRYEMQKKTYSIDGRVWTEAVAKGVVEAFCYHGDSFEFIAPWDEMMLCEDGDCIARPEGSDQSDIYRIDKKTFAETYRKINGSISNSIKEKA